MAFEEVRFARSLRCPVCAVMVGFHNYALCAGNIFGQVIQEVQPYFEGFLAYSVFNSSGGKFQRLAVLYETPMAKKAAKGRKSDDEYRTSSLRIAGSCKVPLEERELIRAVALSPKPNDGRYSNHPGVDYLYADESLRDVVYKILIRNQHREGEKGVA